MQSTQNEIEYLIEKAESYTNTCISIGKLKATDYLSSAIGNLVVKIIVFSISLLLLAVLNIAISLWLSQYLKKMYYAFFIVSGFYLIILLIVIAFLAIPIKKAVAHSIIKTNLIV